jgi:hypothetical protein
VSENTESTGTENQDTATSAAEEAQTEKAIPQSRVDKLVAKAREKGTKEKIDAFKSEFLQELGFDDFDDLKDALTRVPDPSQEQQQQKEAKKLQREHERLMKDLEAERKARTDLEQSVRARDERSALLKLADKHGAAEAWQIPPLLDMDRLRDDDGDLDEGKAEKAIQKLLSAHKNLARADGPAQGGGGSRVTKPGGSNASGGVDRLKTFQGAQDATSKALRERFGE